MLAMEGNPKDCLSCQWENTDKIVIVVLIYFSFYKYLVDLTLRKVHFPVAKLHTVVELTISGVI